VVNTGFFLYFKHFKGIELLFQFASLFHIFGNLMKIKHL